MENKNKTDLLSITLINLTTSALITEQVILSGMYAKTWETVRSVISETLKEILTETEHGWVLSRRDGI